MHNCCSGWGGRLQRRDERGWLLAFRWQGLTLEWRLLAVKLRWRNRVGINQMLALT